MSGRSLFHHRDFRQLWFGDAISQFGSEVGRLAMPMIAVVALAATPFQVGLVTTAETIGFLLVGLPAGVWVDRVRRRPLMLRADLGRAVLLLSVPLAWWAGLLTLVHLLVVGLLVSVLTVFFDIAYQSYVPSLVGREQIVAGNAKLEATRSTAVVTGPAIGGGLVQVIGAASTVLATALGYLASALFLRRIRTEEAAPPGREEHGPLRREITTGLRFVVGHPLLRPLAAYTATTNLFSGIGEAVVVLFLVRELGLTPGVAGAVLTASGIGGVLGALTSSWWAGRLGQARVMWLIMLVTQPLTLLLPLTQPGWRLGLFLVGYLAVGYGIVVYNVAALSFRQSICPDHLLGRMNSAMRFLVWGTLPLGGLLGGALAEWLGVRGALWVAGVGQAAALLWLLFSPLRRMRDLPEGDGQPAPATAAS
ncbi:MFS transporter [Goodfellowiella coeruleoviolacea]|uniref:Arabinose efflux permease, MFS family n=1 Tax=Goodfellowiella coeruleoviolacea TaxID=334858 RepID=A0AAE3GIU9_9PSEU|nr:MFS transporter [Goodfellowiella coeruleoviolacea]MCP2168423.1 putative arabinose efflux permease, MFS family [Goodfellowiella coeruleoviolacea]